MKKKILICLNPFESHFLPMITFINYLKGRGFLVLLIGDKLLKEVVNKAGFDFISLSSFAEAEIQTLKKKKDFKKMEELYRKCHQELYGYYCEYEPDYILMGISKFYWYLKPALEYGTNIYFYSLCCGIPYFNINSPPITSDYIPKENLFGKIQNLRFWIMRMKRKGINMEILRERQYYPWKQMRKICKKKHIRWKFGIDGFFPNFPILIFGTRSFEFVEKRNLYYLGVSAREDLVQQKVIFKDKCEKLIYCSFGTMNYRYEKYQSFLYELIEVFRKESHWKLILSVGTELIGKLRNLPDNIVVYKFAPQIAILKRVDLVITHGGYGTIKECIYYGVPMLVFPCIYDQRGNAARVHYLQIGIRDLMLETTKNEGKTVKRTDIIEGEYIKQLIRKILYNPKYKNNIMEIRNRIDDQKEMINVCESIFRDKNDEEFMGQNE